MRPLRIEHIGILVANLEEGIDRWSRATGYTFSPVARYRTSRYSDHSNASPHLHDARISFSKQRSPRIELMEATGSGTHGSAELGIHHLGMTRTPSPGRRLVELARRGVNADGIVYGPDDEILLWFSDKRALDGIRLEFISKRPGPLVADNGSELWIDPATGHPSIWGRRL
jgi:glyoxalase/bleomycin resistance protein/dioxygenase superfamily protein